MIPPGQRGTAYGVFYAGYGIAWFFGSALLGKLLDASHDGLIAFSVACQLLAGSLLLVVSKRLSPGERI
jgi:predicted MFS family arabinose efflux permease